MKRQKVKREAVRLLVVGGRVPSGELSEATDVSRQTAHAVLTGLVEEGVAQAVGTGRGAHYVLTGFSSYRWDVQGLEEHRVWDEILLDDTIANTSDPARSVFHYAVSKMVNNVIDHSRSDGLTVGISRQGEEVAMSIQDVGVGVFEKVRATLGLESHFDALGQISKGKLTTDPERHTGEGIFFTSKAVDRFTLSANGIEWVVDNVVGDVAVGVSGVEVGTVISLVHDVASTRTLESVFDDYSSEFEFDKSRPSSSSFNTARHSSPGPRRAASQWGSIGSRLSLSISPASKESARGSSTSSFACGNRTMRTQVSSPSR